MAKKTLKQLLAKYHDLKDQTYKGRIFEKCVKFYLINDNTMQNNYSQVWGTWGEFYDYCQDKVAIFKKDHSLNNSESHIYIYAKIILGKMLALI